MKINKDWNIMQEYVVGFMFARHLNQVALIHKQFPDWQKGKYNGIGGKIEKGETYDEAMVREFLEETGYQTNKEDWKYKIELNGPNFKVHFFACFVDRLKDLRSITEEQVGWFNFNNLPFTVIPNLKWIIPLCLDDDISTPIIILDKKANR